MTRPVCCLRRVWRGGCGISAPQPDHSPSNARARAVSARFRLDPTDPLMWPRPALEPSSGQGQRGPVFTALKRGSLECAFEVLAFTWPLECDPLLKASQTLGNLLFYLGV